MCSSVYNYNTVNYVYIQLKIALNNALVLAIFSSIGINRKGIGIILSAFSFEQNLPASQHRS